LPDYRLTRESRGLPKVSPPTNADVAPVPRGLTIVATFFDDAARRSPR
jgi:hypothetical protein